MEAPPAAPAPQQAPPAGGPGYSNGHYQQPQQPVYGSNGPMPPMPPNNGYNHPSYMNSPYQPPQQQPPQQQQQNQPPQQPSPQQQQQQTPYGQMPGPGYYANQQVPPQYMQQQQQGYWAGNNPSMPRHQEDDKSRLTPKKELK